MDHSVNVLQFAEARASEIATLMHQVTSSDKCKKKTWFQNLPHHMRRRGASQNPKRVPKNLRGSNQSTASKTSSKGKRHKKKPKDLKVEYANRSKPDNTWLENHIWHAKRFKMKTMWGYQLPIHSNDRKIGSSYHAAANRAMLQDLSYYCCIELNGVQEKLLFHLSVLTDALAGHTFSSAMFLDGTKEGHTFVYHPNNCPYKAIGPVSFIWKPVFDGETHTYKSEIPNDSLRQLWIWCHPSIHSELIQVLVEVFNFEETTKPNFSISDTNTEKKAEPVHSFTFACKLNFTRTEQRFCKEKTFVCNGFQMVVRKDTLVRHRLIGPMSQSILAQVLRLADVDDSSNFGNAKEALCGNGAKKFKADVSDLSEGNDVESFWWKPYFKSKYRKSFHASKGEMLSCLKDPQSAYYVTPRSVIGLTVGDPRIESGWREVNGKNSEDEFSNDFSQMDELLTPDMADSALWEENVRNEVTATKLSDQEINKERSNCIGPVELGNRESRIPIIIVNQSGSNGFGSGWDIIAPIGWSLEFWRAFERKGGRPAGLRDIQMVNLEAGHPSFPCSFPDTEAGTAYEENVRTENLTHFYKRPKSKRPNFSILGNKTPFFMCWKTLVKDWEKEIENPEMTALFPSIGSLLTKNNNNSGEYYVLRQKELNHIGRLCASLNKITRRGLSNETKDKLSEDFNELVMSIQPEIQFSRSLLVLKLHCLNKGRPSLHSRVYLLNEQDRTEVRINPQFCGPIEPAHASGGKAQMNKKDIARPQVESFVSVCSRKLIGYVSEGGFSSLSGQGYALGHCTSLGLLVVMKQCFEAQLRPLVLIREQHCFKYRVATVEVIENYL